MTELVVDPVTRIEGHLGIKLITKDVETKAGTWKVVDKAYSLTNLFRGFEIILKGRDPRDAFYITQRICGVCPAAHAEASIQALDQAFDAPPTPTAVLIRNIIQGAYYVYDHLIHTYLLVGPEIGIVCKYPPMVPPVLGKSGIEKLGLGLSYAGCVQAQRIANQIVALWGGKFPHHMSEYPGGVTVKPTLDRIAQTIEKAMAVWDFCAHVAIKDLEAIRENNEIFGEKVSEITGLDFRGLQDLGANYGNFLSYGLFPDHEDYDNWMKVQYGEAGFREKAVIKAGAWMNGRLVPLERDKITEDVKYSRYDDSISGKRPWEYEMTVNLVKKDKPNAYAWMKAPRYAGEVMEVGPMARMMVTFGERWKLDVENPITGETVSVDWKVMNSKGSVIDRVASRIIQALLFTTWVIKWAIELKSAASEHPIVNPKIPDYKFVPETGEGWGFWEAPRGALLHYVKIKNKVIENYQCVVPSTWNLGPRDDMGRPGAVEKSLEGCPLPPLSVPEICNAVWSEEDIPLNGTKVKWGDALAKALTQFGLAEINMEPAKDGNKYNVSLALAIVRSFDPCIACGTHAIQVKLR